MRISPPGPTMTVAALSFSLALVLVAEPATAQRVVPRQVLSSEVSSRLPTAPAPRLDVRPSLAPSHEWPLGLGMAASAAAPHYAHHEGLTVMNTVLTVGIPMGLSALVNLRGGSSSWERSGALAFSTPFVAMGTVAGALVGFPTGAWPLTLPVGAVGAGLLGGRMGRNAGTRAEAGDGGARTTIRLMWGLSIPATALIASFWWVAMYES